MAKRVSVIITDDLDESENAETVSFGLDGVTYEIDLNSENRAAFEQALAPFIASARRLPRGSSRRPVREQDRLAADRSAVRVWARSKGLEVSERGRISRAVLRNYEAAHLPPGLGGDHRGD